MACVPLKRRFCAVLAAGALVLGTTSWAEAGWNPVKLPVPNLPSPPPLPKVSLPVVSAPKLPAPRVGLPKPSGSAVKVSAVVRPPRPAAGLPWSGGGVGRKPVPDPSTWAKTKFWEWAANTKVAPNATTGIKGKVGGKYYYELGMRNYTYSDAIVDGVATAVGGPPGLSVEYAANKVGGFGAKKAIKQAYGK